MNDLNSPDNTPAGEETSGIRLQVFLAHAGVCSRRGAADLIASGRITVNGIVASEAGSRVQDGDEVTLDGQSLKAEEHLRYVLLNKPAGYVCSLADEKGRPVAADLLKEAYSERLYNIGRLDMYSSGALLFTNDGAFAAVTGHPSAEIEKEYQVETVMAFHDGVVDSFSKGLRIEGVFYRCKDVERLSSRRLRIVLVEGKNREIRRVLEHFDIRIKKLVRVRIGPVLLGDLAPGACRDLTAEEVTTLMSAGRKD